VAVESDQYPDVYGNRRSTAAGLGRVKTPWHSGDYDRLLASTPFQSSSEELLWTSAQWDAHTPLDAHWFQILRSAYYCGMAAPAGDVR
jgi:hypothetical protein